MKVDPKLLEELGMSGRIDELLALVTLEEIAEAWCRYQLRSSQLDDGDDDDPDWWAVDLLMDATFLSNEQRRREVLRLLVSVAPNERVLSVIGAGPLEDFVTDDEDRLRWIEFQAETSESFREALSNVWIWDDVRPETFDRVEAAARTMLPRPK